MRRRDAILMLGGAVLAWAGPAFGQPADLATIGVLNGQSSAEFGSLIEAFRRGLSETGHIEGRNVAFQYRWAAGRSERLPELAADLVNRHVNLIFASGSSGAALAAKAATTDIPIVFVSGDPIRFGLVANLNRPEGNLTGVSLLTNALGAKRLQLLREVAPKAAVVGLLVNPNNPHNAKSDLTDVEAAAAEIGQSIEVFEAGTAHEIDAAFVQIAEHRIGALLVGGDPFFVSRRHQLAELTVRNAVPAIFSLGEFPAAGALMSYGTSIDDIYRRAGVYAGRILAGAKPGDLPVQQPTKIELVVNLKAARALRLTIPPSILARADEVIE